MKKVIKIKYDSDIKKAYIYYENKFVDSSLIDGKDISQWVYPFMMHNKRWNGIYEEMKNICNDESFVVIFIGSDSDFDILRDALKDTGAELLKLSNKVEIIYNDEDNSVKITVNDENFDTSRIDNMSIEEWIMPFESEDVKWKGIFSEITGFLGINSYSVQFSGNQKYMNMLMDNCPENIDITYKPTVAENSDDSNKKSDDKLDKFNFNLKSISFSKSDETNNNNNNIFSGNNAFSDGNTKSHSNRMMSSIKSPVEPKTTDKSMSSVKRPGNTKSGAKGMSSLKSPDVSKNTAKGMSPLKKSGSSKSTAKNMSSIKKPDVSENNLNEMSALKNDPAYNVTDNDMDSINLKKGFDKSVTKLNKPEDGWEDDSKGLIKEIKTEISNIGEYNSMLSTIGMVLCIVSAAGILLSVLFMSKALLVVSSIPAIVFAVLAFKDEYRKAAVATAILDIFLVIIGWVIISIR